MNEPLENYPQPDPAWDYYEIWNICLNAKAQIEKALALMKEQEVATKISDLKIFDAILSAHNQLAVIDFDNFKIVTKNILPDEPD